MLSSRTRRRGSRRPSHSGIVTIFLFFWIVLERSDHQILRKIWRNGHKSCVYVCNDLRWSAARYLWAENLEFCKLSLMFRSRTATTHTRTSTSTVFLPCYCDCFIRFWLVGKFSNILHHPIYWVVSRTFSSVLPRRILCKSRQIYESVLWLVADFSFPGFLDIVASFPDFRAFPAGQPTKNRYANGTRV